MLNKFGLAPPPLIDDVISRCDAVVLTDHNQRSQVPLADEVIPKVRAIIDHHPLQALPKRRRYPTPTRFHITAR